MSYSTWMRELLHLAAADYQHPAGDSMWDLNISMKKQYTSRKICFEMRTYDLNNWDPGESVLPESFR